MRLIDGTDAPAHMQLPGGKVLLDVEAAALHAALAGERVLIVGGVGSRGDIVAAVAAAQGSQVCGHAVCGRACTESCQVLRGGPEVVPTCTSALPKSVAAWSSQPAAEVVPLTLHCWFDAQARVHRAELMRTSLVVGT